MQQQIIAGAPHSSLAINERRQTQDSGNDDWRRSAQGLFVTGPLLSAGLWLVLGLALWKLFG
jgi:hypothetical protein